MTIYRGSIPFLINSILVQSNHNNTKNRSLFANQFLEFLLLLFSTEINQHLQDQKLYCLCFCAFKIGQKGVVVDFSELLTKHEGILEVSFSGGNAFFPAGPATLHQELRIDLSHITAPSPSLPQGKLTMALNQECSFCDVDHSRVWTLTASHPPLVTGPGQQPEGTKLVFHYNPTFKNHFSKELKKLFNVFLGLLEWAESFMLVF